MNALQVIDAARAAGVTLFIDGDGLLLRSGSPPPPGGPRGPSVATRVK